jgi:DNA primase
VSLNSFLERHPNIKRIDLCLDNDEPGIRAMIRISKEIKENPKLNGIKVNQYLPKQGKDWCDYLVAIRKEERTFKKNKEVNIGGR